MDDYHNARRRGTIKIDAVHKLIVLQNTVRCRSTFRYVSLILVR